jgi:hypothetical protein
MQNQYRGSFHDPGFQIMIISLTIEAPTHKAPSPAVSLRDNKFANAKAA